MSVDRAVVVLYKSTKYFLFPKPLVWIFIAFFDLRSRRRRSIDGRPAIGATSRAHFSRSWTTRAATWFLHCSHALTPVAYCTNESNLPELLDCTVLYCRRSGRWWPWTWSASWLSGGRFGCAPAARHAAQPSPPASSSELLSPKCAIVYRSIVHAMELENCVLLLCSITFWP